MEADVNAQGPDAGDAQVHPESNFGVNAPVMLTRLRCDTVNPNVHARINLKVTGNMHATVNAQK